jgi:hypothetical protein
MNPLRLFAAKEIRMAALIRTVARARRERASARSAVEWSVFGL